MIHWNKIEWKKRNKNLPQRSGNYLCRCIVPRTDGNYSIRICSLYFDLYFSVEDMIVTHWAELPNEPNDISL